MIKRILIQLAYRYVFPLAGLFFVKIISLTYKIKVEELGKRTEFIAKKNSAIYASWHQRFFPAITFFAKKKPIAAIISQSRDGELISRVVSTLGWSPVRGSSSKGGAEALKGIIPLIFSGYSMGHAVDGPRGPFAKVKPGIIKIAQLTQVRIVPVIISFNNYWVFNSWDHFMIPKPFARITMQFAKPHKIPRYMSDKEFEEKRLNLEKKIIEFHRNADLTWGELKRNTSSKNQVIFSHSNIKRYVSNVLLKNILHFVRSVLIKVDIIKKTYYC